jgi:hypothetical protein
MMNTRRILIVFAACALMCGIASASTLEETFTGSATTTTQTDFAGLLSATQFNPAWGTLTGVEIDLTSNATTSITITNTDSTSNSSGSVQTKIQIFAQDAGNNLNGGVFSTGGGELAFCLPGACGFGGQTFSLGANSSVNYGGLTGNQSQSASYTLAAILAEFIGTGTETLHTNTLTGTVLTTAGGNTIAAQSTTANITGDVIYTYNSNAPEPATLFLMGSALVGVGVLRKRFKA